MENRIKSIIKKLSRFGYHVKPKTHGRIDPVCGMESASDLFQAEYKGKSHYFCSNHCKEQFAANPANYAD